MATASRIQLEASQQAQYRVEQLTPESARKASELLQRNHEQHHIYFNNDGFHNHIAHHILTLFALGASPAELQKAYDVNASYQRPAQRASPAVAAALGEPEGFAAHLGKQQHYNDFLALYEHEIDTKGWRAVVDEHVFCGSPRADDMLVRLFAGFLHPLIHLGFGVEFAQPAIIAEALAQAAVHDNWMAGLFFACEDAARQAEGDERSDKTMVEILEACRADDKLVASARFDDANKIRDGILKRAPREMVRYATQYVVRDDELERQTAEMMNACVYFAAAAQRPPHQVKFDFFYMHCVNSSIFFSAFVSPAAGLGRSTQRRLLQWKVWNDITMYVSRGSPALLRGEVEGYTPTRDGDLQGVTERVRKVQDDGHASKLVRAILHAERVGRERIDEKGLVVRGEAMWRRVGHMAVDSVEAGEPHWVRSCGFEQAWKKIPLRDQGAARL